MRCGWNKSNHRNEKLIVPFCSRETVDFVRTVEAVGTDYLTVHARTHHQRSSTPALLEATKLVKESVCIPVVANGDAFSMDDVERIAKETGANGESVLQIQSKIHPLSTSCV